MPNRPEEVTRRYGLATDTWSVHGLTFSIATPVDGVPDPRTISAEALKRSIVPAIPARLTVDEFGVLVGVINIEDVVRRIAGARS